MRSDRGSTRPPFGLWLATAGITVFLVRVVVPVWGTGFPRVFPDTSSFAAVADRGPFWPRFWFDERPVGMPLVFWAVGRSDRMLVLLQATAYAVAAVVLCAVLWRILRNRVVAALACLMVVAIALQPRFAQWSAVVLSESLGLTTAVLSLAAWLWFAAGPDRRRLWLAVAASLAWILVRDSHVVPFALVVIPALVAGRLWWRTADSALRRSMLHAALLSVVVCLYVTVSQDVSDRNRYPVMNNVGQRVLPDEDMTQWFVDGGMPLDAALRERTGASSFDDGFAMLEDPDLAEFREWADGPGQRRQLLSFMVKADVWTEWLGDALPGLLDTDLGDYDIEEVGERLPSRLVWLDGPRTTGQLLVWTLLSVAALATLALIARRRLLALVVALALASAWIDVYLSFAGDSVEVARHLVGSLFRLILTMVVAVALGVDALAGRRAAVPDVRRVRVSDVPGAALVGLGSAAVMAAFFGNELRSQDYDPQFARTIVERAAEVGGTYYQNGIHNKGPFEMVVYDAARWITDWGSYWFGISAFVIAVAGVVATTCWVTARRLGGSVVVALAAAGAVGVHLTLSTSDYAGVLYSRNLTSAMLAGVFALALWERPWRDSVHQERWLALCGALLGLAVQTLLTTVLAAAVIGALVITLRGGARLGRNALIVGSAAGATVLAAPVWYELRGSGDEFWAGWWTYARFMSSGTGRSLADQVGLGWRQLVDHVGDRPEVLALVVVFAVVTWSRHPRATRLERLVHSSLLAWLAAAWVELVASQRYSSHYFSVTAVPLALMATVLAVHAVGWQGSPSSVPPLLHRWRTTAWMPLTAVTLVLLLQCASPFWSGLAVAGRFTGFDDYAAAREQARGGPERSARAVLDLVGDDRDPVLAWTMYPWTYLDQHRVPATRLSWKSFMLGEIYLGRTSPDYVLPQTWEWFAEDVADTRPAGFLTVTETPVIPGTPFAEYVDSTFVPAYAGPRIQVHLRDDLAPGVIGPVEDGTDWLALAPPEVGWTTAPGSISLDSTRGTEPLQLDDTGCLRLGATVDLGPADEDGFLIVRLTDLDGSSEDVQLGFDGEEGWSASDQVEFERVSAPGDDDRTADVVVVVGERSAALVVDGAIVAAARIDGPVRTTLLRTTSSLTLTDVVVGAPPEHSGC